MTKVSVVVPIYNVENYLEECLESVINQTYKNLEIICVEDCSTDNSRVLLENFAQKDSRIKIIYHQTNRGLSAARNSGIDHSSGDYIYFIDSDDWIDDNYIENLVKAALDNNAEIVVNTNAISKYNKFSIAHLENKTYNHIENSFIDATPAIQNIIWNTWTHLWNRNFLNRINARFPEGELIEDIYFQIITYLQIDKIYIIRNAQYHHRFHSKSIMATISKDNAAKQILRIINLAIDYAEEHSINKPISLSIIPQSYKFLKNEKINIQEQKLIERIQEYNKKVTKTNEE